MPSKLVSKLRSTFSPKATLARDLKVDTTTRDSSEQGQQSSLAPPRPSSSSSNSQHPFSLSSSPASFVQTNSYSNPTFLNNNSSPAWEIIDSPSPGPIPTNTISTLLSIPNQISPRQNTTALTSPNLDTNINPTLKQPPCSDPNSNENPTNSKRKRPHRLSIPSSPSRHNHLLRSHSLDPGVASRRSSISFSLSPTPSRDSSRRPSRRSSVQRNSAIPDFAPQRNSFVPRPSKEPPRTGANSRSNSGTANSLLYASTNPPAKKHKSGSSSTSLPTLLNRAGSTSGISGRVRDVHTGRSTNENDFGQGIRWLSEGETRERERRREERERRIEETEGRLERRKLSNAYGYSSAYVLAMQERRKREKALLVYCPTLDYDDAENYGIQGSEHPSAVSLA